MGALPRRTAIVSLGLATAGLLGFGLVRHQRREPQREPPLEAVVASPQVQQLGAATTDFGLRLLQELARSKPGLNVFFSPYSVSSALGLAWNGAGGETEREIATTLGLAALPLEQANEAYALLRPSLERADSKVELSVANALWVHETRRFDPDFQERAERFYDAETRALDFTAPASVSVINGWVREHTDGRIDKLIEELRPDSVAVLTNAVYFHGKWKKPFSRRETRDRPFHLTDGSVKTLPSMSREGSLSYLETEQFQLVSLPYGNGRLVLDVLLPLADTDLTTVLAELDAQRWSHWVKDLQPRPVELSLPRFEARFEAELKQPLEALGMPVAFTDSANFTPMGLGHTKIGAVRHKAFLKVDEEGTVATAATAVEMVPASMPPPPAVMRVDRPFLCAVRDTATGTLLFIGVIRDPSGTALAAEQSGLSDATAAP